MASTIITKNSSTASSVPLAADLTQGELAVNVTDKRLFTENASGTVVELGTNPSSLSVVGNATVGGTLGVTGATTLAGVSATTLSASSTVTLSGGTANGVTYLNGSKVVTSGSALTFDGSALTTTARLLVGTTTGVGSDFTSVKFNSGGSYPQGLNMVDSNASANGSVFQVFRKSDDTYLGNIRRNSTDNALYVGGNSYLALGSGDTEQMRLTSTGLGIGTSTPTRKISIGGTSSAVMDFYATSYRRYAIGSDSRGFIIYDDSASAYRMEIDSSGNLGLGVTPSAWGSIYKAFQAGNLAFAGRSDAAAAGASIALNSYRNTSDIWTYKATGYASSYEQGAGAHYWFTAASGTAGNAITFTQVATIDASGNFMVGVTSTSGMYNGTGSNGFAAQGAGGVLIQRGSDANAYLTKPSGYANSNFEVFAVNGSTVGSISTTGSATAYNTSSDYRLKNITGPITTSGAYIDSLNPVEGTWKADGSVFVGLIAHEVQEASRTPVATGTKDGSEMQSMDYSNSELIANLIAEVKSLRVRVAQLESN